MSDLIKREDAIKIMACEMYAEAQSQGYEVDSIEDFMPEAKAWMNDAPSADRPQGWIPCSERMPEESGRYLVTRGLNACDAMWNRVYIINYSDLMGLNSDRIWWNGNVGKSDFEHIDDVLAWMPLPKPWKGASR